MKSREEHWDETLDNPTISTSMDLLKDGLTNIPLIDTKIECFVIDNRHMKQLPFFAALDDFMERFFKKNRVNGTKISYAIWGGVAANLMLCLIGKCNRHYSYHDIELFLSRDGKIFHPNTLIEKLRVDLSSDPQFLIELGGISIIKGFDGILIDDFQKKRIHRNDGDIYLNNIVLIVNRDEHRIYTLAPQGTFLDLIEGKNSLKVKDASDLQDINRLARRIYRNISKLIRYQQVTRLCVDTEAIQSLERLIKSYSIQLENYFLNSSIPSEEREITAVWIAGMNIDSVECGKRWLYFMALSETAKRLAGLQGLSNQDQAGFCKFLLNERLGAISLFDHPLIQLIRDSLADPTWPRESAVRLDIAQKCYLDFSKYQKPGAEKLCEYYSINYGNQNWS